MTNRRKRSLLAAVVMIASACTGGQETTESTLDSGTTTSPVTVDVADLSCTASGAFDSISIAWNVPEGVNAVMSRDGVPVVSTKGPGGHEDLGVEVSETYSYTVDFNFGEHVLDCGQAQLVSEVGQPTCSVAVDTFAVITWDLSNGRAEVYRNGERILPDRGTLSSPYIDTAAPPGLPLTYEVVAVDSSGQERASKTASCGVVTVEALPPEQAELQIAQEAARAYRAPYAYATVVPICADCVTQKVDVYFAFNNESRVPVKSWVDDDEQPVTDDVWFTDPLSVPTLLLEALANGDVVTSVTDEATGLIVQWTINGDGAILDCLEMDLAPLDLRDKDCGGTVYND